MGLFHTHNILRIDRPRNQWHDVDIVEYLFTADNDFSRASDALLKANVAHTVGLNALHILDSHNTEEQGKIEEIMSSRVAGFAGRLGLTQATVSKIEIPDF